MCYNIGMKKRPTYGQRVPKLNNTGYLRVWNPEHPMAMKDGLCLVHRMVYYDNFGNIPAGYHIHHKNHIKTDNRPENLELIDNREHVLEHKVVGSKQRNQYGVFTVKPVEQRATTRKKNKLIPRECIHCHKLFTGRRSDAKYCTDNCRTAFCKSKIRSKKLGL